MFKKYIGITIGPVVKTITNAKRTGQLWGASYIFSYIMRELIKELKSNDLVTDFIIPYCKDEVLDIKLGVGLFPDRLIFEAKNNAFDKLEKVIDKILKDLSENIAKELETTSDDNIYSFLSNYLQIYYLEREIENNKNPIIELSPHLDMLELNEKILPKEDVNYLMEFLKNVNVKDSFLAEDAFGKGNKIEIQSIPEIAIKDINLSKFPQLREEIEKLDKSNKEYYDDFYRILAEKDSKNLLKKHHKYIAIVQADGDNFGQIIKNLSLKEFIDSEKISFEDFSKTLFDYSKKAVEIINTYEGFPIYAGGDDLLFFAPIFNKEKNIFVLLSDISKCFNNYFKDICKKVNPKPTMSFGVSIIYNKFPLYEALEISRNMLGQAKKFKLGDRTKNAVAFRVVKHSGQMFETVISKAESVEDSENSIYQVFLNLLRNYAKVDKKNRNFLTSLHFKLQRDRMVIKTALMKDFSLENYINNTFTKDEQILFENFLYDVRKLIELTWKQVKLEYTDDKTSFYPLDLTCACLRFLNFLNEEGNNHE